MKKIHIIGAGLVGLSQAYELSRSGFDITLLDQGEIGQASSWAGGGILSPLYPWRYSPVVNKLAAWSQAHYPAIAQELLQETNIDPQWTKSGLLIMEDGFTTAQTWLKDWQVNYEFVDQQTLGQIEPNIALHAKQNLLMPEVAQIRNPRLVKAFAAYLQKQANVKILTQTQCQGFGLKDSNNIDSIKTNKGTMPVEQVIITSGAWTAEILQNLQVVPDIMPVKGQMLMYKAHPDVIKHIVLYEDFYVIPRRDGRILVGSTLEWAGFDTQPTEQARAVLQEKALKFLPKLADYEIERHWAGLRPGTKEGIPYICAHPEIKGLYINAGHFRNGVVMAPASARLMADLLLDRDPIVDPMPYTLY